MRHILHTRLPRKVGTQKERIASAGRGPVVSQTGAGEGPIRRSKFREEPAPTRWDRPIAARRWHLCRKLGVSEAKIYLCETKVAHVGASELRKLRSLEDENGRLTRLFADLTAEKHMLM